jgi:hypothetical protein
MPEMPDEGADMDQEIQWLRARIEKMHDVIRDLRAQNDEFRRLLAMPERVDEGTI